MPSFIRNLPSFPFFPMPPTDWPLQASRKLLKPEQCQTERKHFSLEIIGLLWLSLQKKQHCKHVWNGSVTKLATTWSPYKDSMCFRHFAVGTHFCICPTLNYFKNRLSTFVSVQYWYKILLLPSNRCLHSYWCSFKSLTATFLCYSVDNL